MFRFVEAADEPIGRQLDFYRFFTCVVDLHRLRRLQANSLPRLAVFERSRLHANQPFKYMHFARAGFDIDGEFSAEVNHLRIRRIDGETDPLGRNAEILSPFGSAANPLRTNLALPAIRKRICRRHLDYIVSSFADYYNLAS